MQQFNLVHIIIAIKRKLNISSLLQQAQNNFGIFLLNLSEELQPLLLTRNLSHRGHEAVCVQKRHVLVWVSEDSISRSAGGGSRPFDLVGLNLFTYQLNERR